MLSRKIAKKLIRFYQIFISPILGFNCRFNPTCSQYAIEVIERFGVVKGTLLAMKRVLKCNPFFPGGDDPPPNP